MALKAKFLDTYSVGLTALGERKMAGEDYLDWIPIICREVIVRMKLMADIFPGEIQSLVAIEREFLERLKEELEERRKGKKK